MADRIGCLVGGGNQQPQVGILLRNRPAQVATLLGVLQSGATVVVINPARGDERTQADVNQLRLPLIVGEPGDLATLDRPYATAVISISDLAAAPKIVAGDEACIGNDVRPGVAVRM